MDQFAINIIVLGKSGVGKSSFCNYLFDQAGLFETGSGKPVTSWEKNFQSHTFEHQGHLLNVFDSVGLEADNYERWLKQFDSFMQQRRARPMEPETWIHGAFYVINASSARLEPVDVNLIKRLGQDARIPLQVILTNADVAGDKVEALQREIHHLCPGVSVTPLCSVSVRRRGGQSTQAFGRDEVLSLYLEQSHAFLSKRLAAMSCLNFKGVLREMRNTVVAKIEQADLSIFRIADLDLDTEIELPDFDEVFSDLKGFDDYLSSFGFVGDWETSDELENAVTRVFDDFQGEMESRFKEIEDGFESDSLLRKVGALYEAAKIILTLKSTMIEWLDEGFGRVHAALDQLFIKYAEDDNFFASHLKGCVLIRPKLFGIF
ncbi:50S ribosome-binding GTPase [Pseudomonas sp. TNT11]|uniref:50S ribosome-binding GTPase n=1 Tax=Pseudomonas emilianonis TaxID=2915812 RepID=A0ABT0ELU7_9PSED|nr:GTPase [Pseudomonas emilianonis]MCK1786685.1 50S ribosome-binding GTPase [Pseudomonas emilianonis]